jgi:Ca2+-transporting ATPase
MHNFIETPKVHWQTLSAEDTARQLDSNLVNGLADQEAKARLAQVGSNQIRAEKKEPFWEEFLEELREPMVLLLLVTGVFYAIWGQVEDAITIFFVILTLNTVEVVNEQRSKKAIASLRKLAEPTTTVKRSGRFIEIPIEEVVLGDLVYLQAGHRVPADARLIEAYGLTVDESALTGESLPVDKNTQQISAAETPLAEQHNMVYASTLVTRGKGTGLVIATGMNTQIGQIAGMAHQVKEPRTPLQTMMGELSKSLVWFALGFSALVPAVGILVAHQPPKQMLLTGLSLAFATIPEEMPIIITMVLALGAFRLSKKHAIVKRLNSVESLGSVTVIATDKTGTLTENRMEVSCYEPENNKEIILMIGAVCNDAISTGTDFGGDPVDAALLRAANKAGFDIIGIRQDYPILKEFTFDNSRKRMSVIVRKDGQIWVEAKGAPESILSRCTQILREGKTETLTPATQQEYLEKITQMAAEGYRVLAFAERSLLEEIWEQETSESNLTFVGIVGLQDAPRPEAREAIATCQLAGMRVMMITGDHPLTAKAIAKQIGLNGHLEAITGPQLDALSEEELREQVKITTIFARTTPEHKLRIVQALQKDGERVAVTGDGVNDAPALSAADIGIAMGETGTDVAREAGAMVLMDDNFSTIVQAVKEGRLIYENLKKGVRYYLTCKVALVLINLIPTLLLVPVPFAPVQIILMELFMDLMAAAAFTAEKPEADLLKQKPRNPKARFMDKTMISSIFSSSLGLFAAVTGLYLFTWYSTRDLVTSQTIAFFAWLIGHVLLAFNMRSQRQPVYQMGITSNRMMVLWAIAIGAFLALISLIPQARQVMKVDLLPGWQWGMILVATFIGTFWLEIKKIILYSREMQESKE